MTGDPISHLPAQSLCSRTTGRTACGPERRCRSGVKVISKYGQEVRRKPALESPGGSKEDQCTRFDRHNSGQPTPKISDECRSVLRRQVRGEEASTARPQRRTPGGQTCPRPSPTDLLRCPQHASLIPFVINSAPRLSESRQTELVTTSSAHRPLPLLDTQQGLGSPSGRPVSATRASAGHHRLCRPQDRPCPKQSSIQLYESPDNRNPTDRPQDPGLNPPRLCQP